MQVILKPAEATPLTALALAELAHRAGMPDGVLNIVVGDAKAIGVHTLPVFSYTCMPFVVSSLHLGLPDSLSYDTYSAS